MIEKIKNVFSWLVSILGALAKLVVYVLGITKRILMILVVKFGIRNVMIGIAVIVLLLTLRFCVCGKKPAQPPVKTPVKTEVKKQTPEKKPSVISRIFKKKTPVVVDVRVNNGGTK